MTCSGCSGAVTRVLGRLVKEGKITAFDVSLEDQSVVVKTSTMSYEEVMAVIAKTGKSVSKVSRSPLSLARYSLLSGRRSVVC
jgi:copper chaperone CopZ